MDKEAAGGNKVPVPQASNLVGNIIGLTQLLGGTRQTTTTNPGDIAALQKVIADAEAFDATKLLESIFNQAQGAIPQISAGYGRTMGRTYGNAQMQAALGELLKQTTLAGQKQVADLELQNRQLATNAAAAIANATKGTTQTTKTKTPLAPAVGGLLLLQALGSLKGNQQGNVFQDLGKGLSSIFSPSSSAGTGSVAAAAPIMAAPIATAAQPLSANTVTSTPAQGFGFGDFVTAATTPVQAGLNALGGFLESPVSSAVNLVTTPISAGLNLAGEGIDWVGEQASNLWTNLQNMFGGK